MRHWIGGPIARDYSLSSDWDDRWRTGGTVDEVIDEAHLGPTHIVDAIQRFVDERDVRTAAACAKSPTPRATPLRASRLARQLVDGRASSRPRSSRSVVDRTS